MYIPYLLIPYIYFTNFNKANELIFYLLIAGLVTLAMIFLNLYFKGNENIVLEICSSIKNFANINCFNEGKIADLKLSIEDHTLQKGNWNYGADSLYASYFKIYFIGFFVGFFPLIYLLLKSKISKTKIKFLCFSPAIMLFLPILFLFPIFYMGADWGRYLYIAYSSSLIVTLFLIKNSILIQKNESSLLNKFISRPIFILIIFVYCFGWTVPICCEKKFKPGIYKVIDRGIYYYYKEN